MTGGLPYPTAVLIRAVRAWLGTETRDAPAAEHLGALPDYAQRHGLLALPGDALVRAGVSREDPAFAQIASRRRLGVAIALRQLTDLAAVVERLRAAGIRFAVIKGQPLSSWLYGDATFRHCLDIDLIVAGRDRERAARALADMGYEGRVHQDAAAVVYGGAGCWPMQHAHRAPVDLHWTTWGARFPSVLSADTIIADARTKAVAGTGFPVPAAEHTAVLVLTHVAKHVWYSLESVLSIALLARRTDVNWTEVRRILAAGRLELAAAAGLRLARDLLGTEVPIAFGATAAAPRCAAIANHGRAALALPPGVFPDGAAESRAHLSWLDTRAGRLRYRLLRAAEPTYAEWTAVRLPPVLAPLYVPIRLTRLAVRQALSPRRS